jgi:hypothetical protein
MEFGEVPEGTSPPGSISDKEEHPIQIREQTNSLDVNNTIAGLEITVACSSLTYITLAHIKAQI